MSDSARYSFLTAYVPSPPQRQKASGSGQTAAKTPQIPTSRTGSTPQGAHNKARIPAPSLARLSKASSSRVAAPSLARSNTNSTASTRPAAPSLARPASKSARSTGPAAPSLVRPTASSQAPGSAKAQHRVTIDAPSEERWWGKVHNIADADPQARAFMLDPVQAAIGGLEIYGRHLHAIVLEWDSDTPTVLPAAANGQSYLNNPYMQNMQLSTAEDTSSGKITLNDSQSILSIIPSALGKLRAVRVQGEQLVLVNAALGIQRELGQDVLILSEKSYSTLAVAIIE